MEIKKIDEKNLVVSLIKYKNYIIILKFTI